MTPASPLVLNKKGRRIEHLPQTSLKNLKLVSSLQAFYFYIVNRHSARVARAYIRAGSDNILRIFEAELRGGSRHARKFHMHMFEAM